MRRACSTNLDYKTKATIKTPNTPSPSINYLPSPLTHPHHPLTVTTYPPSPSIDRHYLPTLTSHTPSPQGYHQDSPVVVFLVPIQVPSGGWTVCDQGPPPTKPASRDTHSDVPVVGRREGPSTQWEDGEETINSVGRWGETINSVGRWGETINSVGRREGDHQLSGKMGGDHQLSGKMGGTINSVGGQGGDHQLSGRMGRV